jgi:hypothetical protein
MYSNWRSFPISHLFIAWHVKCWYDLYAKCPRHAHPDKEFVNFAPDGHIIFPRFNRYFTTFSFVKYKINKKSKIISARFAAGNTEAFRRRPFC